MYIVLKGRVKVSAFPPAEVHKVSLINMNKLS